MSCSVDGVKHCKDGKDEEITLHADGTVTKCQVGENPNLSAMTVAMTFIVTAMFVGLSVKRLRTLPAAGKFADWKDLLSSVNGLADVFSDDNVLFTLHDNREATIQYFAAMASLSSSAIASTLISVYFLLQVSRDVPAARKWLGERRQRREVDGGQSLHHGLLTALRRGLQAHLQRLRER